MTHYMKLLEERRQHRNTRRKLDKARAERDALKAEVERLRERIDTLPAFPYRDPPSHFMGERVPEWIVALRKIEARTDTSGVRAMQDIVLRYDALRAAPPGVHVTGIDKSVRAISERLGVEVTP